MEFEREHERYLVIKRKDALKYLNHDSLVTLYSIGDAVNKGRQLHKKPPLNTVVVESDWPFYEDVWKLIEVWDANQKR